MQEVVNLLKSKINLMLEDEARKEYDDATVILKQPEENEISLNSQQPQKEKKMQLEDVLKPLHTVDGYLASAIFDMGGEVLVKHNNSKYNVEMIGANAVAMINAAVKAVHGAGLGKCHFIQVNSELGIFGAVWAVEDQSVAAVLLEPKANVGLAKIALAKVGEEAGSKLS